MNVPDSRSVDQLQIAAEVKRWSQLLNRVQTHFVVEVLRITPLDDIHRGLCHCRFHLKNDSGIRLRLS